ncbi:hypothetical protein I302_100783 [Kwoniella bestiolae CBS 10118]|uniref:Uncharacterized protein n=1 Tax=Kwoniella bestiolae CBS 10118 TaxID=1296100 RepID=A0A1B9G646_9TREE|nr:hypothetical protein I302_04156 [Kwoniella bestiolae CBS 10118]OCF26471.1 hypothetical protein I302_04156 [Kwoniella bestiolae CBS 10118]
MSSNDGQRRRLLAQAASLIGTIAGHLSSRAGQGLDKGDDAPSSESKDADSFVGGTITPAESESDQKPPEYEDGSSTPNRGDDTYFEPVIGTASSITFNNKHAGGSSFCINETVEGRTGTHCFRGGPDTRTPVIGDTSARGSTSDDHQAEIAAEVNTDSDSVSGEVAGCLTPQTMSVDDEGTTAPQQAGWRYPPLPRRRHHYRDHVEAGATVYVGDTGEGVDPNASSPHIHNTTYEPGAKVFSVSELSPGGFWQRAIEERRAHLMADQTASSQSTQKNIPEDDTTG